MGCRIFGVELKVAGRTPGGRFCIASSDDDESAEPSGVRMVELWNGECGDGLEGAPDDVRLRR